MQDNNLRIAFDYNYPDTAVLVVYESWTSALWGGDNSIRVRSTLTGEEAIKVYSRLTGEDIPSIHKEAGYTKYDMTTEEFEGRPDVNVEHTVCPEYQHPI